MSEYLEIEGDVVGNGKKRQSMGGACPEEYGGGPCLWEILSYCGEIQEFRRPPHLEQPGRENRRPRRKTFVDAGNNEEDTTNDDQSNSLSA